MTRRVLPLAFGTVMVWMATASAQTPPSRLSADALDLACAPRASFEKPEMKIALSGSLTEAQGVYAPWHRLVVNAGSEEGLKGGEEYYVRRIVRPREMSSKEQKTAYAIMTSGWIHIDQVQSHRSIATVMHACGGLEPGDYLEPFSIPAVPTALPPGTPDFAEAGRVLFTPERGTVGGTGTMVVIDLGANKSMRPGQFVTFYRAAASGPNVIVGHGMVVLVQDETATVKVQDMRDAVMTDDRVAPHK